MTSLSDIENALAGAAPTDAVIGNSFKRGNFVHTDAVRCNGRVIIKAAGDTVALDTRELALFQNYKSYIKTLMTWTRWQSQQLGSQRRVRETENCPCLMCQAAYAVKTRKRKLSHASCAVCNQTEQHCARALCHINTCEPLHISTR